MADGDEKKVMVDETREEPWKYEAERVCDMKGLILVPERLVVASILFYFILIPVFFQDEPWPFEDSQHGGGQGLLDESESHGREVQGKEEVQRTAEEEAAEITVGRSPPGLLLATREALATETAQALGWLNYHLQK